MSNRTLLILILTLSAAGTAGARKLQKWTKPNLAAMQKACDTGKLKVCVTLAHYTIDGWWGATQDNEKATALAKKACDGGEPRGCAALGRAMSYNSNDLKKDVAEIFTASCDKGAAEGCYWLGRYELDQPKKQPWFEKAYKLYMADCDAGDPEACHEAGTMNRNSHQDFYDQAVPWDDTITAKLDAEACGAGFAESCSRLGGSYEEGKGVDQNDQKAKDFYDKGCKAGDSDGCTWKQELIQKRLAAGIRI